MGLFGWSYPPGCSGHPNVDHPCDVCGKVDYDCMCPECPECSDIGNPNCYKPIAEGGHGLVRTEEQIKSFAEFEEWQIEQAKHDMESYANVELEEAWWKDE